MSSDLDIARKCAATMFEADSASKKLGITIDVTGVGQVEAHVHVTSDMMNGFDVCHGGYIFTLADTAFAFACNAYNKLTYAGGASIDFLRTVKTGDELVAIAKERHRGRRSGVYEVTVRNQENEEVAVFIGRSVSTPGTIVADE